MRRPFVINFNFLVICIDFSECLGTRKVPSNFLTYVDFFNWIFSDSLMFTLYLNIQYLKGDVVDLPNLCVAGLRIGLLCLGKNCSLTSSCFSLCPLFSWQLEALLHFLLGISAPAAAPAAPWAALRMRSISCHLRLLTRWDESALTLLWIH